MSNFEINKQPYILNAEAEKLRTAVENFNKKIRPNAPAKDDLIRPFARDVVFNRESKGLLVRGYFTF